MSEPYRPSSGTEGLGFMEQFCCHCEKDMAVTKKEDYDNGCLIIAMSMAFNIGDPEYPKEWVYGEDGEPTCKAFKLMKEAK